LQIDLENISSDELGAILAKLADKGYRFTSPLTQRVFYSNASPPEKLLKAIILDTETTGVNQETDKIIELGMVAFEFCPKTGQAYRVLGTFNELEDPGFPIPPESTKVHGITDEMVLGKKIDDEKVLAFISDVPLIIAHNAKFDRQFVESRFPVFQNRSWGCSFAQVPWTEEGLGSAKLEFLAYRYGFHYEGHRASNDCYALLEVLQRDLPESGIKAMKKLIDGVRKKELKVWALNSPYESKDALKQRGYRWTPERKTWVGSVSEENLDQEVEWLRSEVYIGRRFRLELEAVNAKNRFSARPGEITVTDY
jgi:DNA polymerase-3 subunit epsilon